MKDTAEFPEGTEQTKTSRARANTRSKQEHALADSQEQGTTTVTRRRTPSDGTAEQSRTLPENSSSVSTPRVRPATQQARATTRRSSVTGRSDAAGTPSQRGAANTPPAQPNGTPRNSASAVIGQRQAIPAQRTGGQRTQTPESPAQHPEAAPTPPQRPSQPGRATGPTTQRQAARYSSPATARPTQGRPQPGSARQNGRTATPVQRPHERRVVASREKQTGPVSIPAQIVVKDLAELLHTTANEIIRGLIKHSIFANINQVVEYEQAALVAKELGFEPTQSVSTVASAVQGERKLSANEMMMATRDQDNMVVIPPVVTIMGHVDHGKTSLLDMIRKTKVAAGEAGGITQHIGAYQVEVNGKKITFLDTPGHEAFTAMRARGAQVTHIVIIVIAADDGVMPQTREAISHAQAAKVPIIIALNKIDKDNANPDYVKQQLAEMGIIIEEYGGDVVFVPVSARKGIGIDELLEYILLVAEVQDIKANPNGLATGVIVEAKLEKSVGPVATVLVQQGTLKMGDNILVGAVAGKVRAMFNDRGKRIQKAPPSTPVSIMGLPEVPQAGDRLEVIADERTAKQRAFEEAEKRRNESASLGQVSLDTLYAQMQEGTVKELNVVLKCDVQGSAEAIKNALTKLGEENLKVRLIHEGIGNISETDVHLAAASGAIVIGFNVKADAVAQREAQKEHVDIRFYNVIYKLTDDIQAALSGLLEPTYREVVGGHAEVVQMFKAGKNIIIAGCRVTDGKMTRSSQIRLMRKNEKVYEGKIASLRRGKDDVREVASGYECGIILEDFTNFEVGDILEAFSQERVVPGV
ncbi:MAG: translation initiation factor IF-2 [Chloroflexi bacterium]|nr:translation initiation factor IF-2 [Chloroflexota bacterium]